MKKIISILLLCLLLTGCAGTPTNGGFGGNPDVETTGEKKSVQMVRINGELYYDTETFCDNTPRCGTLDGSLLNVAEEFEIPKKDNGSNFGPTHTTYFGYQTGHNEYCVEVPISGGWKIFRKITDPEFNENKYKYCMYLKGTMPNAVSETEMIVLTNDKELDFGKVTKSMLSSGMDGRIDVYIISPDEENLSWGIHLEADDITPTGLDLEISQMGGYPSGQLQTGSWYEIERLEGGWMPVKTVIDNYAWNAIAYLIPKDGEYETKINWEWLYGKLPKGNYRIAKEIMDFRESGDFDKKIFYAYFEIE